jgi:DNA mismatch repair protein MutS
MRTPPVVSLYRGVLAALPGQVRRDDIPDMVDTFSEMWTATRRILPRARLALTVFGRLPQFIVAEWWEKMSETRPSDVAVPFQATTVPPVPAATSGPRMPARLPRRETPVLLKPSLFEPIGPESIRQLAMDEQTFKDLEIFAGVDGGKSLYDVICQTRTAAGAKVLTERMKRPWADADRIGSVQRSLAFIREHRDAFERLPSEHAVTEIESYLKAGVGVNVSNFDVFIAALEVLIGDFQTLNAVTRGVVRATKLIHAFRRMLAELPPEVPGEVGLHLGELRDLVTSSAFDELGEGWDVRPRTVFKMDRVIRLHEMSTVRRVLKLAYQLDALVSMSDAAETLGLTVPEVREGELILEAANLRNLFVEDPVPAPLALDEGQRMLFLTGPNMAGKTTYLRSCGVAIYLAHLGMGVPASTFRFSPSDCLSTSLSTTDNVRKGISFFRAEALRIKTIAERVTEGERVFALLDEPFKGTNVKDAIDASWAILSEFAGSPASLFVVASHLIELGDEMKRTGRVDCQYFEATEVEGRLSFDFVLKPGVSSQRLGMKVLEQEGIFRLFRSEASAYVRR